MEAFIRLNLIKKNKKKKKFYTNNSDREGFTQIFEFPLPRFGKYDPPFRTVIPTST